MGWTELSQRRPSHTIIDDFPGDGARFSARGQFRMQRFAFPPNAGRVVF
jgi:hypothetical protein